MTRRYAHKNQGLTGLPPIPGVDLMPPASGLTALARWTRQRVRLAHGSAKMNRVFETFHS